MLLRVARQAMIERGLEPEFPGALLRKAAAGQRPPQR